MQIVKRLEEKDNFELSTSKEFLSLKYAMVSDPALRFFDFGDISSSPFDSFLCLLVSPKLSREAKRKSSAI